MYEDMIEAITKEVLHRLSEYESSCLYKKTILVLSENLYSLTEASERELTKKYNLLTPDIDGCNADELHSMVSGADVILITSVKVKQLINLAFLCGDGHLEEAVRYSLLLGKTIFVLEEGLEYRSFKATANKTFYRKLLEYEEGLKRYGIIFTSESAFSLGEKQVKQSSLRNQLDDSKDYTSFTKMSYDGTIDQVELRKKLILEKDLMNLNVKSQTMICIEKDSIVTPSALDYARAHRISLIKK